MVEFTFSALAISIAPSLAKPLYAKLITFKDWLFYMHKEKIRKYINPAKIFIVIVHILTASPIAIALAPFRRIWFQLRSSV